MNSMHSTHPTDVDRHDGPAPSPWTRETRQLGTDPRQIAESFDWVADERVRRHIGRDDSLVVVAECFAELGEETRAAVAAWSESVLHVVEVFSDDPSPVVRAACARNLNIIDVRLQRKLARDADPFVVLALLESARLAHEVIELLLDDDETFDAIRFRLAAKPLATRYLERLAADPCRKVAARAAEALARRAKLQAIPATTSQRPQALPEAA